MTPSELPSSPSNPLKDPAAGEAGMLSLTPDQLQALGLGDCQPGDKYTITLTKSDAGEGESVFEVDDVQPAEGAQSPGGEAEEGEVEQPESIAEPGPGGLNPTANDKSATPPVPGDSDNNLLGYERKKKKPRQGLPDTKKMRE
jgi:hypothetical protein